MTPASDIFARIEVDVVIFTVVQNSTLEKLLDLDIISLGGDVAEALSFESKKGSDKPRFPDSTGLSLFVVTMQGHNQRRVLPSDTIQRHETIEQAARRISIQKLGLSLKTRLRSLKPFDHPNRGGNERIVSFPYWGMVNFEDLRKFLGGRDQVGLELVSSSVVLDIVDKQYGLEQFDGISRFGYRMMPSARNGIPHTKTLTNEMPSGRILAHDYDDMVFYAWRDLRHAFESKLDPFNFLSINPLGDEFRISDLQEFQEICRGERLVRDAFRRAMMGEGSYLNRTMQIDSKRPGKPATLYSLMAPPSELED